ncbi:hypothetical protein LLG95_15295 [bacterium]|nr:hypothetical protein [bacterium]
MPMIGEIDHKACLFGVISPVTMLVTKLTLLKLRFFAATGPNLEIVARRVG